MLRVLPPLLTSCVQSILRELGENFTYNEFLSRTELAKRNMNPQQRGSLDQRLSLLASFVDSANPRKGPLFRSGRVTIIDLSDPFIDPSSACSLFEIITRLFVRADIPSGKVLVTDEAHKVRMRIAISLQNVRCNARSQYLSANHGDSGLTKALTSVIRQQRHLAMRVIISTQGDYISRGSLMMCCPLMIYVDLQNRRRSPLSSLISAALRYSTDSRPRLGGKRSPDGYAQTSLTPKALVMLSN